MPRICIRESPWGNTGHWLMAQKIGRLGRVSGPGIHHNGISNKLCSFGSLTALLWVSDSYLGKKGRGPDALQSPFNSDSNFHTNIQWGIWES